MVKLITLASAGTQCPNSESADPQVRSCNATSGEDGRVFCLTCSGIGKAIADEARAIYEFPFPVKVVVARMLHGDGVGSNDTLLPLKACRAHYGIGSEPDFARRAECACAHDNGGVLADLGEAYFRLNVFAGVTLKFDRNELQKYSAEVFAPGGASTPEAQELLTRMSQNKGCPRELTEVARRLLDIGFVAVHSALGDIAGRVYLCHSVGERLDPRHPTGISAEITFQV